MRVTLAPSAAAAAERAADALAAAVRARPDAVLGLATGATMAPVYAALAARHAAGLSFARVRAVALDEYVGLAPDDPRSFHAYLAERFAAAVGLDPARLHVPRGDRPPAEAARAHEALLARLGPVDVQLLGLGRNGHVGFNEPGSAFDTRTRAVRLSASTRRANAAAFAPDPTPARAVTMGIGTILDARRVVLLATGAHKAAAVRACAEGPVGPGLPASALRAHPDAEMIVDPAAAAALS